ncbi:hypothetical protein [uncultured Microbacterium sp.]|uniref:hypothetical protein n=1 Tax=uncultured Microbacterium sp. TaxID=191216 RepID=UPI0025F0D003|nr:hypothetical protein [uncultured Microbacterium sp.]
MTTDAPDGSSAGLPAGKEEVGAWKVRLRDDPTDDATRHQLVGHYRRLGHRDQAGRYAVGLTEGASADELRAYIGMLWSLKADVATARRLSALTAERDLPASVRKAIDTRVLPDELREQGWGCIVGIAWAVFVVAGFVTLAVVFGFTMAGSRDARAVGVWWTSLTGWLLVGALALSVLWSATTARWKAAAIFAAITVVAATVVVLGGIGLNR